MTPAKATVCSSSLAFVGAGQVGSQKYNAFSQGARTLAISPLSFLFSSKSMPYSEEGIQWGLILVGLAELALQIAVDIGPYPL
jgi:hypothetical protein